MKLELPHRTLYITEEQKSMSDIDKLIYVNEILNEKLVVDGVETTLEYFLATTQNATTNHIKDMLGYFLTKTHRVKEDIITLEGMKHMQKGGGKSTPFSSLAYKDGVKLGTIDGSDEYY